jgi:hypothetical protein
VEDEGVFDVTFPGFDGEIYYFGFVEWFDDYGRIFGDR